MSKYVIGLDFGTNSVRALIDDVSDGNELATHVYNYRDGVEGVIIDNTNPHLARQNPADWVEGLVESVKESVKKASENIAFSTDDIIGIGVDTTGSTPLPVDENGYPLSYSKEFEGNPNAMAWLWKDHTSANEAHKITEHAKKTAPQYLTRIGGIYSSEWFFSKLYHLLHVDEKVFDSMASWVECCDFTVGLLTGEMEPGKLKRSVCAAGHKAMFNYDYGGLPSKEFLSGLHPKLGTFRNKLYSEAHPAGVKAGELCPEMAEKLGIPAGIAISVGAFDAHMGAVGSGIKEGTLVKIMGTSTCDIMVFSKDRGGLHDIPGICGMVDGSVMDGYIGLEAGQSAVGDIFNWFVKKCIPSGYESKAKEKNMDMHEYLTTLADELNPGQSGLLALDWNNGNRTILVDPRLTGLILGMTLNTRPEEIYRALVEATAFGARVIIERVEEYGVEVRDIINCGGLAEKNPMIMQIYADVTGRPMKISRSAQTCALGAAIFGAVAAGSAAGGYDSVEDARDRMTGLKDVIYEPISENVEIYDRLYKEYKTLHDTFGLGENDVMKRLLDIKESVL